MVIVQVGQKPVKSVEEFRAAMEKQSLAKGVMLLVRSAQGTRLVDDSILVILPEAETRKPRMT